MFKKIQGTTLYLFYSCASLHESINFCKLAKYLKPDVCSILQTVWHTSLPQNKSRDRTLKHTTFVTVFQLYQSRVLRR